jgi:hypothetical protein
MPAKESKKIAITSSLIKSVLESMQDMEVKKIVTIAGITGKVKVKHSEVGSGLIFLGDFIAKDEKSELEASALVLPPELGERIARKIAKGGQKVRFAGSVSIKKTAQLSVGYAFSMDFATEPETMGQVDLVRDMLKTE